jgi:hypothetical protein
VLLMAVLYMQGKLFFDQEEAKWDGSPEGMETPDIWTNSTYYA